MDKLTNEERSENLLHNIVWLRREHGLSKTRMARLLGVGVRTLERIEGGELPSRLTVKVFFRMEEAFGCSSEDLLNRRLGE